MGDDNRGERKYEGIPWTLKPLAVAEAVAFLRDWLPAEAIRTYREMIRADPLHWHRDPHFQGGLIVEHALLGNGITARALGAHDLDSVWPELLRMAVIEGEAGDGTAAS